MNRDEVTVTLFQNIDTDALVTAKREGNLLSYLSKIAEKILGPSTPGRREDARETVRQPTPQPDSVRDTVRVSRL